MPSDCYFGNLDETWNKPETPMPVDKDISIDNQNVYVTGGGFFNNPIENFTDFVVGNSSMKWTCTISNIGDIGFCNFVFNTPLDLSDKQWLNYNIKSKVKGYYIDEFIVHSADGNEIIIYKEILIYDDWDKHHIELPQSNKFNWQSVDAISLKIKSYNGAKIGDSILIDGFYFSKYVDDYWGESGDDDLFAEVYIGRACTDNIIEVGNYAEKIIKYMSTNPEDNYLKKVIMAAEDRWGPLGSSLETSGLGADELIDGSSNSGYFTTGIPSSLYEIKRLYMKYWGGIYIPWIFPEQILQMINNNFHIINHLGHSAYDYNMRIYSSDVDNLTNNKPCFIYSQGCDAGGFDNPEGYDCIAEHFTVKTQHGAFAGIWNSRVGLLPYRNSLTDGPSQRYHREFWDAVFGEEIVQLGRANQDSKEDNAWRIEDDGMRFIYYGLTFFGDPSLKIGGYDQNQSSNPETNPSNQPSSGQSTSTSTPGGSAPANI